MMKKKRSRPSRRDLEIWERARKDLSFWLYKGLTGRLQTWGHRIIHRWAKTLKSGKILEIGCGPGHHLDFGNARYKEYHGLDLGYEYLAIFHQKFPGAVLVQGDIQYLPYAANSIDTLISIFNLEHLPRLSACLKEIKRVLKPEGVFLAALPAEGGFLYRLGRSLTSKPYMEKKYGIDYDAVVRFEHRNSYPEILKMVSRNFIILKKQYVPFNILRSFHLNAFICLKLGYKQ